MILALASERGGIEKSILATNLAALCASEGRKVLLIDADTQQSSRIWSEKRCIAGSNPKVPVRRIAGKGVGPELENLALRYDDIVIDTEGRDCLGSRSALVTARVVVIPICPDRIDPVAVETLVKRIETARLFNPQLQVLFVIVCAHPNLPLHDIAVVHAATLNIWSARFANTTIHKSNSICTAFSDGLSILEYRPIDEAPIAEIQHLYHEVFGTEQPPRPAQSRTWRNVLNKRCL